MMRWIWVVVMLGCGGAAGEETGSVEEGLCGFSCLHKSPRMSPAGPISATYHTSQFADPPTGQSNFYSAMADYYSQPTTDGDDGVLFEPEFLAFANSNSFFWALESGEYNKIEAIEGLAIDGRCRATNSPASGTDHEWYFYSGHGDTYEVDGHCNGSSTALHKFYATRPDGSAMQKSDFISGNSWQWVNFGTSSWSKAQSLVVTIFTRENP